MGRRRRSVEGQEQLDLFAVEPANPPPGLAAAVTSPPSPGHTPAPVPTVQPTRLHLVRTTAYGLAEKIAGTWHAHRSSEGIAIPLGVTATLALLGQRDVNDGRDVASHVLALDPAALLLFLRRAWAHAWLFDPYLVSCAGALGAWLDRDQPAQVMAAVHAVTRTAITSGLLGLTGDPDLTWRCQYDVLGALLTVLRSPGARDALAEHHSPPDMANLLARMSMLEVPEPGKSFDDPTAGTGGLIRAAALSLRLHGADPHDYLWSMGDIDPLAAACCAINAMVWSLGRNVLIFCGDCIATGNGPELAAQRRQQLLDKFEHFTFAVAGAQALIEAGQIVRRLTHPAA